MKLPSPLTRLASISRRSRIVVAAVVAVAVLAMGVTWSIGSGGFGSVVDAASTRAAELANEDAERRTTTTGVATSSGLATSEDGDPELAGPRGVMIAGDAAMPPGPVPGPTTPVSLDPVEGPPPA